MLTYPAPAKLNLFLHVVGRRPDGYHELQTVFQFLDFGDRISFSMRNDGTIRRPEPVPGVAEDEDLTVRAARLLQAEGRGRRGCEIHIEKRIPLGGGLGGGSSNAATTLLALNHLWSLGLPLDRLAQLGLSLGADVPVFVRGQAAWAEGIGDQLTPVDLPQPWYLVVTPPCHVATAELYAAPDLRRDTPRISPEEFRAGRVGNDFEPVARARHPEVGQALDWLRLEVGAAARLSGSGASVFAPFEDEPWARLLARRVPAGWRAIVARGCNRSPMHALVPV